MTYDLSKELDRQRFQARAAILTKRGAAVELSEKSHRSRNQNNYLHLLIGVVAMETGTSLPYCKEVYFKRLVNPAFFVFEKADPLAGKIEVVRSSAELSKEEMTMAIDRFKRWAAENGIYLPDPEDEARLRDIALEMDKLKTYL